MRNKVDIKVTEHASYNVTLQSHNEDQAVMSEDLVTIT